MNQVRFAIPSHGSACPTDLDRGLPPAPPGNLPAETPKPARRAIPEDAAEQLFAVLRCHRDRALISFWLSSGARAAELLGLRHDDLDVGARTITVVSKGSRACEAMPRSLVKGGCASSRIYGSVASA